MYTHNAFKMSDLFSPSQELGLINRIGMPPMTRYSPHQGVVPTQELDDYYVHRADTGAGLIIIESAPLRLIP